MAHRSLPPGLGRLLLCAALLGVATPGLVLADYEGGVAAYTAGDHAAAIAEWRPAAEAGDSDSQYGMGLIFESGRGVGRDYAEAARWYRMAAEQGHPGAQFNLGHLYRLGTGVPTDMEQAIRWWRAAAQQGLSQAQLVLGVAYQRGDGVAADPATAVAWFRESAGNGNPAADYALGLAYETGRGVERDLGTAIAYYEAAAAAGIEAAHVRLATLTFPATAEDPPPPPSEEEVQQRMASAAAADDGAGHGENAELDPSPRYIQIAAFIDEDRAERAWIELRDRHADLLGGLPHRVLAVDLGGESGLIYRLQAGPVPAAAEAEAICTLLKARNAECFLVAP